MANNQPSKKYPDLGAYHFDESESVAKFIEEVRPGAYAGINAEGESVLVSLNAEGEFPLEIKTLQGNGWFRINEYDRDGNHVGEMYEANRD